MLLPVRDPLPVGQIWGQIWGHVICISQSEARDGAELTSLAYLTLALTLTLTLTLTRSSTFVTSLNLGKYPRF